MTPNPTRPKKTALLVWAVHGFVRMKVVVGAGITPRDPHRHPFYTVRTPR